MCGIVGFIDKNKYLKHDPSALIKEMLNPLFQRGPDGKGVWFNNADGVYLGHTRLAVIDVTDNASQPMTSYTGRYVITFNGEIYNYKKLKKEVNKFSKEIIWKSNSDTEVLLNSIEIFGFEKTLQKIEGMFAFAVYDKKNKVIYLARDRVGEKPLYYGLNNDIFFFGSQLKAFKKHPLFKPEIDRDSISMQFRFNYIPSPFSIYKNIKKLPPGTFVKITTDCSKSIKIEDPVHFWSYKSTDKNHQYSNFDIAVRDLELLLQSTIEKQMISDVPLGSFLSGGIDSSLVTAIMQSQKDSKVETFSIGFNESNFNEAHYAKAVAKHLGTKHNELYVSPKESIKFVDKISEIYDEPFSDSSQLPTAILCELTRKSVTVALSGDGADELFGGYNRYLWTRKFWKIFGPLPLSSKKILASFISLLPPAYLNNFGKKILGINSLGDKTQKLKNFLNSRSIEDVYLKLISHWGSETSPVLGVDQTSFLNPIKNSDGYLHFEEVMMSTDIISYLPDDILVKVDRAAMFSSLETRVPFLSHNIIELSSKIPINMKIDKQKGKLILRRILSKYVPEKLINRPKMGFGVPIDSWLRGPLKEWASDLLDESKIKNQGYLDYSQISSKWNDHLLGKRNWQYHLWDVLIFQQWIEKEKLK